MALPAGLTPKTVTFGLGSFFDGTLVDGTVSITAPVNVLHVPTGSPIFSSAMQKKLVAGEATFDLCPTDHPDLNRVDWTYKLTVKINGALVQPDPINFTLPVAGPDTVDLDSLVSVPSSAGTPVSVQVLTATDLDPLTAGYVGDDSSQMSAALGAAYVRKVSGGTAAAINAAAALADGATRTVLLLDHARPWTLEAQVNLGSNTTLDLGGQTVKAAPGFPSNTAMIANADQVNGNTGIRIINGKLDGQVANQGATNFKGIYLKMCDHCEVAVDTVNVPGRGWQIEGKTGFPKPRVIRLRGTVDNCGDYAVMVTNGMRDVYWDDVVVQNCRSSIAAVYLDASEQYGRISAKFNASGSGVRFNNVFGHDLQLYAAQNGQHGVYIKQLTGSRVRIKSHNNGTLSGGVGGSGYADVFVSDDFGQSYGPNAESTVEFEAGPLTSYGGQAIYGAATEDYALYVADGNSAAFDFHLAAQRISPGSLVAATRMPAAKPGLTLSFPNSDRRVTASADVTLAQDGTFTTDTDLTASLPVGEYELDGYVIYESSATADIKVGLVTPSGTTGSWTAYGPAVATAAAAQSASLAIQVLGPAANQALGGTGAGNSVAAIIRGRLAVTTAGTVAMRFAQNTAEASSTSRHAGAIDSAPNPSRDPAGPRTSAHAPGGAVTEPIEPRPAPVVDIAGQLGGIAAGAFSAVAVLVMTVVSDGIHPDNLGTVTNYVSLAVAAVAGLVGWIVQRIHARKAADQVTPLSDPRDHRMRPLKVDPDFYGKHAAAESSYDWYDRGGYVPGGPVPVVNTGKPEPVFTAEQVRAATGDRLDGWPGVLNDDTEEIPRVTDQPVRRIPEHVVPGHRLGRHVRHDPRSLSYLVPETTTPTTAMWTRRVPVFDQGDLGSCTGNAAAGVLGTDPFYATLPTGLVDDEGEAVKLYSAATSLDDYPGTYPPDDTGSDGLSVAKACKAAGLISGYQHITSVAAAQTAIKSGPFIVGCEWWTSMDNPDADGLVTVHGTVRGGHEFVCDGYDVQADEWHFTNSWGSGWGKDGHFKMSSASFAKLLAAQGDATVFLPAAAPFPPSPQPPAPTPPNPPAPVLPPASVAALMARILHRKGSPKEDVAAAKDYDTWLAAQ